MRAIVRQRARAVLRPIYHRVLRPQPPDPTHRWRGNAEPGEDAIRVAYYGDCGFRAMDQSHGVHNPIGWPVVVAERLQAHGRALDFSSVFTTQFEWLPPRDLLAHHLRLKGDPDVVIVQLGILYGRYVILPDTPRYLRLRNDIGRRLGERVFAAYRPVWPLIRRFGKPTVPYQDAAQLERFLRDVRSEWPEATVGARRLPP